MNTLNTLIKLMQLEEELKALKEHAEMLHQQMDHSDPEEVDNYLNHYSQICFVEMQLTEIEEATAVGL